MVRLHGPLTRLLQRSYQRWIDSLDPASRVVTNSPFIFLLACGLVVAILGLLALVPSLQAFFQLRLAPALACFVLTAAIVFAGSLYDRRRGFSLRAYGAAIWTISLAVQFFATSLVAFTQPPGAFLMGALPILVAAYQGWLLRAAPRTPFVVLAGLIALAAALALQPDATHRSLFVALAPMSLLACLLSGSFAVRTDLERAKYQALRSAIQAQVLEERALELRRISGALGQIVERNHDASNALSTSLLSAEYLVDLAKSDPADLARREELREVTVELESALQRLKRLVDETRRLGRVEAPEGQAIAPAAPFAVARRVAGEQARCHPGVPITCRAASPRAETATAAVWGGEATLHDALENLVMNACQGDGRRGPTRVEVVVRDDPGVRALVVQVVDDGPGFAPELLLEPITAFRTTKAHGSGLGLFTTERLVRASGGTLARDNGLDGGAVVTLYLIESPAGRS